MSLMLNLSMGHTQQHRVALTGHTHIQIRIRMDGFHGACQVALSRALPPVPFLLRYLTYPPLPILLPHHVPHPVRLKPPTAETVV
jgi:hypothetical protein